jgi:hypothetical protein
MSGLGLLLSVVALDGCGIAAKVEARNDMMTAKTAYTSCLASADSPETC